MPWSRILIAILIIGLAAAPAVAQALPRPDNQEELQIKYGFLKAGIDMAHRELVGLQVTVRPQAQEGIILALDELQKLVQKLQFDLNVELQELQKRTQKRQAQKQQQAADRKAPPPPKPK